MEVSTLLFVACVVTATGCVQAIAGFGFALLAVPVLVLRLDVQDAVTLSVVTGTTANVAQAWQLRRNIDRFLARRLITTAIVGLPFGLILFRLADPGLLRLGVGLAVLLGVVVLVRSTEPTPVGSRVEPLLGFASGVLLAATSMNGPPLVVALQRRGLSPDVFRATLNAIFLVTGGIAVVVMTVVGTLGPDTAPRWVVALPGLFLGLRLGSWLRRFVPVVGFRRLVLVLLAVSGLSSIVAGLGS